MRPSTRRRLSILSSAPPGRACSSRHGRDRAGRASMLARFARSHPLCADHARRMAEDRPSPGVDPRCRNAAVLACRVHVPASSSAHPGRDPRGTGVIGRGGRRCSPVSPDHARRVPVTPAGCRSRPPGADLARGSAITPGGPRTGQSVWRARTRSTPPSCCCRRSRIWVSRSSSVGGAGAAGLGSAC